MSRTFSGAPIIKLPPPDAGRPICYNRILQRIQLPVIAVADADSVRGLYAIRAESKDSYQDLRTFQRPADHFQHTPMGTTTDTFCLYVEELIVKKGAPPPTIAFEVAIGGTESSGDRLAGVTWAPAGEISGQIFQVSGQGGVVWQVWGGVVNDAPSVVPLDVILSVQISYSEGAGGFQFIPGANVAKYFSK